ncbi:hypothetical protein A3K64_02935 [Candidatus Micrarchaeota archaeon RBG_16_36_9]|nr:MAG: hypothetical protein A3K64_02935 [Candidatus Micrarchaeota archaeon RBG_16_36_9]
MKEDFWIFFGKKHFQCPGEVTTEMIGHFRKNRKLPEPCDMCYKALIFWGEYYDENNEMNFLRMIKSFDDRTIRGKYNSGVAVFYFETKEELLEFLQILKGKIREFGVKGRIQWRRACKAYQEEVPSYWKNAKEIV